MFFDTIENLFQYILEKNRVIVYGDLGRLPHIIMEYLSTFHPRLKIFFVSAQYPLLIPNTVQQFRKISERDVFGAKCDLLVLLEPRDYSIIHTHYPGAGSVVVFTSHAILEIRTNTITDTAVYFRSAEGVDRIDQIEQLRAKLEGSEEQQDVQIAKSHVAHPSVLTIGPNSHCDVVLSAGKPVPPPPSGTHFVVVDLTTTEKRSLWIFLRYLDAFDYMAQHLDRVERWSVCFAPGGLRRFENFVQACIDRLHCTPLFRPYLRRLLPLLSFYKSGTIDIDYDIPVSRIVQHEYVTPDSLEEAFKSAIMHDTLQLVGGVLSIIK